MPFFTGSLCQILASLILMEQSSIFIGQEALSMTFHVLSGYWASMGELFALEKAFNCSFGVLGHAVS